jgi:spermidine/putrescine-binding protein
MGLLRRFKPQIRAITPGYGELPGLYRRGEILASTPDWIPTAIAANKGTTQIRATILEEGAFSFVDCWMRVAGARHPDAAYRLLDHAIGREAQQAIALSTGLGIVNQAAVLALDAAVTAPWRYDALDRLFVRAPLYDGVPLEAEGDLTSSRDWTAAWDAFKAG